MGTRVGLAIAVAVVAVAATAATYHQDRDVVVDFERGFEGRMISEFHDRERTGEDYFRWTKAASYLDFHHLPSSGQLSVEARLRVRRPGGEPLPNLAFTANGTTVYRTAGLPSTVTYHFELPARHSKVRLGIRSDTFDPSGERPLGVQVLGVTIRLGDERPSWLEPAAWMGVAALLLFASARVAGVGSLWGASATVFLTLLFVYLLAQHAVRFTPYPREVAALSATTLLLVVLVRRLQKEPRTWLTATIAVVFVLEMGVAFYPLTLSSDAHFQANRMQHFHEGDWHPTSVTQHHPPFEIPYPISLYVVATPLTTLGLERETALVVTTAGFDVLVSVVLILLAWRFLDDVRGGVLAALLYQLVPVNPLTFSAGNFTNLFAVAMLTSSFLLMFSSPIRSAFLAFMALTAHFGMLLEGVVLWPAWLMLSWLGPAPVKDDRVRWTSAMTVCFLLVGVYYLGYWELFTGQLDRVLSAGTEASPSGVATVVNQLGWVFLAIAALGSLSLVRRPRASTFHAAATVWLGVTLVFCVVDLVSALEIRYILQALPLLALCGGTYLSSSLDRSHLGRTAATAAMLYIVVTGLGTLRDVALVRYHYP